MERFGRRCFSSSLYRDSLRLPVTRFPHRVRPADRPRRDAALQKDIGALCKWQWAQVERKQFVLHDGPPYANGEVHLGHAVNKVLKDVTLRHKLLAGWRVHFVPGWDCHGLPVEHRIARKHEGSSLALRKKAFKYSQTMMERQKSCFCRWGLLADWSNYYVTCHPGYITEQLRAFQQLYEKELVYRDFKPVFWSPYHKTSLAEAELEYNTQHVSTAIYVKFHVSKCPDFLTSRLGTSSRMLQLLAWTTTPWTLPANQAVCYSPNNMYSIVSSRGDEELYLIAEETRQSISNALGLDLQPVMTCKGSSLEGMLYLHPVHRDRECPLLPGVHVTVGEGTGLVHTAPNHGMEDYVVANEHHLPLQCCLVDDDGRFTAEAPEQLRGLEVLSPVATHAVLTLLGNDVRRVEQHVHRYPYDWRSNTPVLVRSSRQWFFDVRSIRDRALECLERDVVVEPAHLKNAFIRQLESAPQWCISRQRMWGTPIPAFYCGDSPPIVHRMLTEHLCSLIELHGIDSWWELPLDRILPAELRNQCGMADGGDLQKGSDIMDIWFDSGVSWKCVLPGTQVSDVCIEGLDQIRGWFNASLLTSVALREEAPFRKIFVHGFVTDSEGAKMSKSRGNVVSPSDITDGKQGQETLGIDVLRWWIASHAAQHENVALKRHVLEECSREIDKLRNVFRFLLGNLQGFALQEDCVPAHKLRALDLHMLHLLHRFSHKVLKSYEEMHYKSVTREILNFVVNEVSSFYCQLVKDRLYCDAESSAARRSCCTVLSYLLDELVRCVAPLLPHLAEEVLLYHPEKKHAENSTSVFRCPSQLDAFLKGGGTTSRCVELALVLRSVVLSRESDPSEAEVTIVGGPRLTAALRLISEPEEDGDGALSELFGASSVNIVDRISDPLPADAILLDGDVQVEEAGSREPYRMLIVRGCRSRCARCRRHRSEAEDDLCARCQRVLLQQASNRGHTR